MLNLYNSNDGKTLETVEDRQKVDQSKPMDSNFKIISLSLQKVKHCFSKNISTVKNKDLVSMLS